MGQTHTPGPWSVRDSDTVMGPRGNVVAECCGYSDKATTPEQQAQGGRESNARLIAAAPELLEACKAILRAPSVGSNAPGSVDIRVQSFVFDAVRAALRKAEGGVA